MYFLLNKQSLSIYIRKKCIQLSSNRLLSMICEWTMITSTTSSSSSWHLSCCCFLKLVSFIRWCCCYCRTTWKCNNHNHKVLIFEKGIKRESMDHWTKVKRDESLKGQGRWRAAAADDGGGYLNVELIRKRKKMVAVVFEVTRTDKCTTVRERERERVSIKVRVRKTERHTTVVVNNEELEIEQARAHSQISSLRSLIVCNVAHRLQRLWCCWWWWWSPLGGETIKSPSVIWIRRWWRRWWWFPRPRNVRANSMWTEKNVCTTEILEQTAFFFESNCKFISAGRDSNCWVQCGENRTENSWNLELNPRVFSSFSVALPKKTLY